MTMKIFDGGWDIDSSYPFLKYIKSKFNIDFYVDTPLYNNNDNKKIYIQVEPNSVVNHHEFLTNNNSKYDYVLCHDASYIKTNGISYIPSVTWINPSCYQNVDTSIKKFKISHMSGWKNFTIGHNVRQDIYMYQSLFTNFPITFFRSGVSPQLPNINNNPTIPTLLEDKVVLFTDYQFSIIVENAKENNYISEKLVDCLIMKTIPIYYGCPNISKYYNTKGWIIIESSSSSDVLSELQERLKTLNESYYESFKDDIETNYRIALSYSNFANNLLTALKQIPFIESV